MPSEPAQGTGTTGSLALSELYGIGCRSCGAPRDLSQSRCRSCDAAAPDDRERQLLAAHQDRLRRLLQRIRALKVQRLVYARERRLIRAGRWTGVALAVAFMALLYFGAVVGLSGEWSWRGCGSVLLAAMLWGAAATLLYRVSTAVFGAAATRARLDAAAELDGLEVTTDALCPACGGHSQVLRTEDGGLLRCPWCSARLVAGDVERDAQESRLRDVASRESSAADVAYRMTIPEQLHDDERQDELPAGFEEEAGGITGQDDGLPMWCLTDVLDGREITRLEVTADTSCGWHALFVQADTEDQLRRAASEWHHPLPTSHRATWIDEWHVYSDSDRLLEHRNALALFLYDLEPGDALCVDGAGVSLWRTGISTPEMLLEQRQLVTRLIEQLRSLFGEA